jgi:hypothetical protein
MKEKVKKAELLSIVPKEVDGKVKIEVIFSDIAKWLPKELLKIEITLEQWLQFLEDCFKQLKDPDHVVVPFDITLDFQKSQVKVIGLGEYAFSFPKSNWKRFIEGEAEKLLLTGVIQLE